MSRGGAEKRRDACAPAPPSARASAQSARRTASRLSSARCGDLPVLLCRLRGQRWERALRRSGAWEERIGMRGSAAGRAFAPMGAVECRRIAGESADRSRRSVCREDGRAGRQLGRSRTRALEGSVGSPATPLPLCAHLPRTCHSACPPRAVSTLRLDWARVRAHPGSALRLR